MDHSFRATLFRSILTIFVDVASSGCTEACTSVALPLSPYFNTGSFLVVYELCSRYSHYVKCGLTYVERLLSHFEYLVIDCTHNHPYDVQEPLNFILINQFEGTLLLVNVMSVLPARGILHSLFGWWKLCSWETEICTSPELSIQETSFNDGIVSDVGDTGLGDKRSMTEVSVKEQMKINLLDQEQVTRISNSVSRVVFHDSTQELALFLIEEPMAFDPDPSPCGSDDDCGTHQEPYSMLPVPSI
ncbi:hypothetical protein Tco_0127325 [Tanacetum coccineum]